jgi:hypothetical protein
MSAAADAANAGSRSAYVWLSGPVPKHNVSATRPVAGSSLVLLCYVDESTHGSFHGFAAVLADDYATRKLTASLNKIMDQASVDYGILRTTEIHAHPMFHGQEAWRDVGVRARVALFYKIVDAIVSEDLTILLRSVDQVKLELRQARENYPVAFPPEQVCFQHILQRADRIAESRETHCLIIADNRSDRERHREHFATYQTQGTPGVYMRTTLDRLLDTVHFAPSHQSRMLQAADVLAFIYRRRQTVKESDARSEAAMHRLWGSIVDSQKVYDLGSWPP